MATSFTVISYAVISNQCLQLSVIQSPVFPVYEYSGFPVPCNL
ncbi:hypothetical protein L8106_11112 [Lyngbya sp. PCC 8106]|nr:hypothetical protein L8106_11112 [Lyngbya sp. PCC 8106]